MKKDIDDLTAIEKMVNSFYEKVNKDDLLSVFFNEVIKVNWEDHLPKMYRFWESILINGTNYSGNPIAVHQHIHQLKEMKTIHFERWVQLFNQNLDENFTGIKTELARQRAKSIATVMQLKLHHS